MHNIVFIVDSDFYKNCIGKTSYNFVSNLANCPNNKITIFYTDQSPSEVCNNIVEINPDLIVVFDINCFHGQTNQFAFIFDFNKPVYLFLDDSYYISSITGRCNNTQRVNGIIFWYKSDAVVNSYKIRYPDKKILNMSSRFVNTSIYKDYGLDKKYDILFYGSHTFSYEYKNEDIISIQNWVKKYENINNTVINYKIKFYPLREKILRIINNNLHKYNVCILPEATISNCFCAANEELAKLINQSYLTIACPSIADVLFHKHLEISASKSVILGNYPSDYADLFEGNIIKVDEFMSDEEIISIIDNALSNKEKLIEMSNDFYHKIHNQHNLDLSIPDFERVISEIFQ